MTTPTDAPAVRPADAAAAGMLPRKTFDVELKEASDDGSFVAYFAVFGNVDRGGDVIEPGAFDNLDEFVRDGWIALNHDNASLPVGYPTAAEQDDHGLKVAGRFHSTPEAQAVRTVVRERMAAGKAVKGSIGYVTRKESYERRDDRMVRHIERLSLYESSFVNLPMNPAAEATDAKGNPTMPEKTQEPPAETKAGRAISKANREKIGEYASAMEGHYKALKELHKAMCKTHDAFKEYMAAFDSDGDEDGDEPDADDEPTTTRGKKPKKNADPQDTGDGDPPKAASRETTARKLAALRRP